MSRQRGSNRNKGHSSDWIYGRRPVAEVLKSAKRDTAELVLPPVIDGNDELLEMQYIAQERSIPVKHLPREVLDRLCNGGNHQGVAVKAAPYPYADIEDAVAMIGDEASLFLILDHLEDPQNVGSLLRTADAAGVDAVIIPEDRACAITPTVVRASAGATEHLTIVRTVNVVRAMQCLKEAGVWLTGLDMDGKQYTEVDFTGHAGLVIGAEGKGLSRLARENCDFIASLPMFGEVASLNAAVAGAIALYETVRQRIGK